MNRLLGLAAGGLILLSVLGCDSPPWSRFIVANNSTSEIRVRFYTEFTVFAAPCIYSADEWAAKARSCNTPKSAFTIEKDQWLEILLSPREAVEIDRARYPDVEENIESNFLIDRLDIHGSARTVSWTGRRAIFEQFRKEDSGLLSPSFGRSPKYVIYYE